MNSRSTRPKDSLLYLGATAIQGISTIGVIPLLTRWFGTDEFGRLALALIAAQVLASVLALGLPGAVARVAFDVEGRFDEPSMVRAVNVGLAVMLPLAFAGVISAPILRPALGFSATDQFTRQIVVLGAGLAGVQLCLAGLRASRRPGKFVVLVALSTLGAQLFAAAIAESSRSVSTFVAAYGVALAAVVVLGLRLIGWRASVWPSIQFARRCLGVSGPPIVLHGLGVMLIAAGDRIVIDRILGLEAVGRYHVAYALGSVSIVAVAAVNNQWAVDVYSTSSVHRQEWLRFSTASMLRFGAACAVAVSAISPLALPLLAGSNFELDGLSILVAVVASSAIPYVVYLSAVHVVFVAEQTRGLAAATLAGAAANVVLNLLLVPTFELVGAATATLITYVVWALAVRAIATRHLAVRLPSAKAFGVLLVVTCGGGATALLPVRPTSIGISVVIIGAAAAVAYRQLIRTTTFSVIRTEGEASS